MRLVKYFHLGKQTEYFLRVIEDAHEYHVGVSGRVGNRTLAVQQRIPKHELKMKKWKIIYITMKESLEMIKREQRRYERKRP